MDRRQTHQRRLPVDEFYRRALCVRERNRELDAPSLLCRINVGGEDCFPNGTLEKKANAGAVIDDTYYYGKNVGKSGTESIYYVSGLGEVNATFHTDTNFVVSGSLFDDKILDFAPLTEPDGFDTLIDDGVAGRSYLIGIGGKFEVFVARIGTDGAPESYAVLDGTTVDWGNGTADYPKAASALPLRIRASRAKNELLFAENGGAGLFRLELPLDIPTDCWNTGDATGSHTACNEPATLVWVGPRRRRRATTA